MIGTTVSHYRVTGLLGRGGMGEVYRAQDTRLDRPVALKFLGVELSGSGSARARFLREAKIAASIDHPRVCAVYDVGEAGDGRTFLAMAFCEGVTLRQHLAQGSPPLREAVRIARETAEGLAAAHAKGVVHRDLKPTNLMIAPDGGVRILDFGLALLTGSTRITRSGVAVGTYAYMSPEQAAGEEVDARSDVFSLGVVLYELLAGRTPFRAPSDAATLRRIVEGRYPPLRESRPDLPADLEAIVDRALARKPRNRYPDAHAMLVDLRSLERALDLDEGTAPRRVPRPARRGRVLRVAVSVAAVAAAAAWAIRARDPTAASARARTVVVLAAAGAAGADADACLLSGLAEDTSAFLQQRGASPAVVPASWVREVGATRAEDAAAVLGADLALTIERGPDGGEDVVLSLRDARTLETLREERLARTETGLAEEPGRAALRLLAPGDPAAGAGASPPPPLAYYEALGRLASPNGDVPEAVAALERIAADLPASARVLAALGEALRAAVERGDAARAADAEAACRRALSVDGAVAAPRVTLGRLLLLRGEADGAIRELEAAVAMVPSDPDARRWLARAYHRARRLESALAAFRAAAAANPWYVGAWEGVGAFLFRQGDYQAALDAFREAERIAPAYGETYNYLGACYYALDCWERAIAMFEKSFEIGRNRLACANLGTLYYMSRRFEDAERMYAWALEYDPTDHVVTGDLAAALHWIEGRAAESRERYRQAAALGEDLRDRDGDRPQVLASLAGAYALVDAARAEDRIAAALALAPDDPEVLYRATLVEEALGNRERALIHLQKLLHVNPSLGVIRSEPFLDSLRVDPRYRMITDGLPAVECRASADPRKGVES
jgi:serine/threonine-protein kinase